MDKILLVDDDQTLLEVIKYNLVKDNYRVITATDGIEAVNQAHAETPDLVILDLMLPGINGLEVCRILRQKMLVPILILTAKAEETDKVVGLEVGADDYLTKPFSMRELMARVKASLRRAQFLQPEIVPVIKHDQSPAMKTGGFTVDLARHEIAREGKPLILSLKEFEILAFLIQHQGQVFSRENLVEKLWGYDYTGNARTVDVHISSLRHKIEDNPSEPKHLLTVQCVGYKFEG